MPSEKVVKRLFALSGNVCAFPGCQSPIIEESGVVMGEICHICANSPNGPRYDSNQTEEERNSFENLILLCRRHHKVIDSEPDLYSPDALIEIKKIHEDVAGRTEKPEDIFFAKVLLNSLNRVNIENNSGNIAINSSGVVQGKNFTIKASKEKIKINAPNGTIGSDGNLTRYIEHLIKRYNQYARSEPSRKTKGSSAKSVEIHRFRQLAKFMI